VVRRQTVAPVAASTHQSTALDHADTVTTDPDLLAVNWHMGNVFFECDSATRFRDDMDCMALPTRRPVIGGLILQNA